MISKIRALFRFPEKPQVRPRILRFLNGNWHKKTVSQIRRANSNNRVSSSKFIMTCWCYQSNVLLTKNNSLVDFISLFFYYYYYYIFRELYYNSTINVCNLKIFLQSNYSRCIATFKSVHFLLDYHPVSNSPNYRISEVTGFHTVRNPQRLDCHSFRIAKFYHDYNTTVFVAFSH